MSPESSGPVLYVVACAAPPVLRIRDLLVDARRRGWNSCLILTPTAARWLESELSDLAQLTGHPVRSHYKLPGEPDVLPPADAIVAAPITSNSVNKWAAGISDTLVLGLITEGIGKRLPMTAVPSLNRDQDAHPAFAASVRLLRSSGVTVVLDDDGHALRELSIPQGVITPWEVALDGLEPIRLSALRQGSRRPPG